MTPPNPRASRTSTTKPANRRSPRPERAPAASAGPQADIRASVADDLRQVGSESRDEAQVDSKPGSSEHPRKPPHQRSAWGVLVYLAGDTAWGANALKEDLREILRTGGSEDLTILVQHDGPEGATRYVVPACPAPELEPKARLGPVDSGGTTALLDFLRWGLAQCRSERLALLIGSPYSVAPGSSDVNDGEAVLSLTYDQFSNQYLNVSDLADVLREALDAADREAFDLLVIDSCYVQFLELAYELDEVVRTLIAPQTSIPEAGWDYRRVLTRWKSLAAMTPPMGTTQVAEEIAHEVIECYASRPWYPKEDPQPGLSVSALDLRRLDEVASAFDTLCVGTMQVLGEGLIWRARSFLLDELRQTTSGPVYDCGSFFTIWSATLEAFAQESNQGWLSSTLLRARGTQLDHFFEATARYLEDGTLNPDGDRRPSDARTARVRAAVLARVAVVLEALRAANRREGGERLAASIGEGFHERMNALRGDVTEESRTELTAIAQARDAAVLHAITKAQRLLPDARLFDLRRSADAAANALRLADQAKLARTALIGSPGGAKGMVLTTRTAPSTPTTADDAGWPRWSGVSIYRPGKLDDLMNASYQRFEFHRRVHWAALLGAANLIAEHPRAMWRLISSLLATGSAATRRDVLRRLTGRDSVIWGLRDQFRVMAPAPTLSLSLEKRNGEHSAKSHAAGNGSNERYLLRLESATRGAVISEQDSRVQPAVFDRALNALNVLLQQDVMTRRSLEDLRAIGGLLGEDIFQTLGRTLDEERRLVLEDTPDATPHLQLQIPRELMGYPWELLHHRGRWLGEHFALGRQVFMETGLSRRVPARRQGHVRALVIGDPVFDHRVPYRQLPGARDEAEHVAGWFERAQRDVGSVIDFDRRRDTRIHTRLTSAEMRALLRDGGYDIIHFAGHGVFRADDREASAWMLSDGELWALEIRNTLADHPAPPWLVFANACEAGMDGVPAERRYQGNVTGLATAFINQGVAAYIAPLWPINDLLAQFISLEFYRQLLAERTTLGEALRRAKEAARRATYPQDPAAGRANRVGGGNHQDDTLWAGLGWASLVLYGDPTEELFHALAGGTSQALARSGDGERDVRGRRASSRVSVNGVRDRVRRPSDGQAPGAPPSLIAGALHAPDHRITDWVQRANWRRVDSERRGASPETDALILELVEDAGLRRWRVARGGSHATTRGSGASADGTTGFEGLPGSEIAALLQNDRLRELLPGKRGILRVVGRWVIGGLSDGVKGLVKEYDREQVPTEGLLRLDGKTSSTLVRARRRNQVGGTPGRTNAGQSRALLLVHGTFSNSASPVDGFGPDFIDWARQRYDVILTFDHWTLSRTPEENAKLLVDELRAFDAELLQGARLDLVTHSRGGLVGRSFCELLDYAKAVRNLVFIGTPNCGTDLANPKNWGSFADLLVNMTGVGNAETFGQLAGLLAQLAVGEFVNAVPGLEAQSPESVRQSGSFLHRLQNANVARDRVRYSVVCSEFEPTTLSPNLKKVAEEAALIGLNTSLDALFADANDLVVNTANAWSIAGSANGSVPSFLGNRVLLYRPPETHLPIPPGVSTETALGVHHCNLFGQAKVQDTIKEWLQT